MNLKLFYEEYLKDPGIKGSIDNLKHALNQQQKACDREIYRLKNLKMDEYTPRIKQLKIKSEYYKRLVDHLDTQMKKAEEEKIMTDLESLLGFDIDMVGKLNKMEIVNIYSLLKTNMETIKKNLPKDADKVFSLLNDFLEKNNVKLSVGLELKDIFDLDADTTIKLKNIGISDIFSLLIIDEEVLIKELGNKAIELIDKAKRILRQAIIYEETIGEILDLDPKTTVWLILNDLTDVETILKTENLIYIKNNLDRPISDKIIANARQYRKQQIGEPDITIKLKDLDLKKLTVPQLKIICEKYDVKYKADAKEDDIIQAIKTQAPNEKIMIDKP